MWPGRHRSPALVSAAGHSHVTRSRDRSACARPTDPDQPTCHTQPAQGGGENTTLQKFILFNIIKDLCLFLFHESQAKLQLVLALLQHSIWATLHLRLVIQKQRCRGKSTLQGAMK